MQTWKSPDGSFHHLFLKLDFDCEPDNYPGILIVSDVAHRQVRATAVKSLLKELPLFLKQIDGEVVAYWWLEDNDKERTRILSGLTDHPVFVG